MAEETTPEVPTTEQIEQIDKYIRERQEYLRSLRNPDRSEIAEQERLQIAQLKVEEAQRLDAEIASAELLASFREKTAERNPLLAAQEEARAAKESGRTETVEPDKEPEKPTKVELPSILGTTPSLEEDGKARLAEARAAQDEKE